MYPFERFSPDAKRTLQLAQEEAERAHHSYIGTEHLLLGILRVETGVGFKVLIGLGIEVAAVRETIASVLGRNERIIIQQIIPTSRVKQVIEISFDEARRMGKDHVDSGHLLLGLVIEGEGIAAHVLADLGATADRVIEKVETEMGVPPGGPRERRPTRPGRSIPITIPARTAFGGHTVSIGMRPAQPAAGSSVETFRRLLDAPHVARLLVKRGVDVEGLRKLLETPPDPVIQLRRHLASVMSELETATAARNFAAAGKLQEQEAKLSKKLEKVEQEWLDSLAR